MKVGSLFAGIGGLDVGFERAGFDVSWCIEINEKCQSVLRRHFPNTKLFSDVRNCTAENLEKVDIITAGFPCQDLSCAGKRKGLNGERSGLFYEATRIIRELRPRYAVFENVPGLLTSASGLDFAAVLDELDRCGSRETAWRCVDSRFYSVAQRRKRVFIVADFGGESASQILFEQEGVRRHFEKGEGKECKTSSEAERNAGRSSYWDGGQMSDTLDVSVLVNRQTMPEKRRFAAVMIEPDVAITHSGGINLKLGTVANTLSTQTGSETTAMFNGVWQMHHASEVYRECEDGIAPTLQERMGTGGNNVPLVGIRRLMPIECERLQGFPDGWTEKGIDLEGKEVFNTDSHRYRMLGNAVTTNVAYWLAQGIKQI